jgi:hypothetical protein
VLGVLAVLGLGVLAGIYWINYLKLVPCGYFSAGYYGFVAVSGDV